MYVDSISVIYFPELYELFPYIQGAHGLRIYGGITLAWGNNHLRRLYEFYLCLVNVLSVTFRLSAASGGGEMTEKNRDFTPGSGNYRPKYEAVSRKYGVSEGAVI